MPPSLLMRDCCVHNTFCVGYGSNCCPASLVLNEPTFRRRYRAAVRHEPSLRDSNPTTKPTVPIPTQPLRDPQPSAPSTSTTPFPPRFFMNCSKGACLGGQRGGCRQLFGGLAARCGRRWSCGPAQGLPASPGASSAAAAVAPAAAIAAAPRPGRWRRPASSAARRCCPGCPWSSSPWSWPGPTTPTWWSCVCVSAGRQGGKDGRVRGLLPPVGDPSPPMGDPSPPSRSLSPGMRRRRSPRGVPFAPEGVLFSLPRGWQRSRVYLLAVWREGARGGSARPQAPHGGRGGHSVWGREPQGDDEGQRPQP